MYITSGACDTVYDFFICYELVIEVLFVFVCLPSLEHIQNGAICYTCSGTSQVFLLLLFS